MLLLQRPTGTWDPPAGRLSTDEGFEDGAVRELYEETGLSSRPGASSPPGSGRHQAAVSWLQ